MKSITIKLGGREYQVAQLPIRPDAEWRKSVAEIVQPISELAISSQVTAPTPDRLVRLAFTSALLIDPQAVLDAVLRYSETLEADREWIENNAYSDEALAALLSLFFGMTPAATAQTNGSAPQQPATI
jgi:hypothetical protein